MADRVAAVREIAIAKRKVTPRLTRAGYLRAVERAVPPSALPQGRASAARWRASSSRRGYEFTQETTAKRARRRPARGVPQAVRASVDLSLRALEEPDAVRRPHHRVDDREGDGRAARAAARRGGDLQPAPQPDAARDRRDDPLRARHPGHGVADEGRAPLDSRRTTRASTPACRRRRSRTRASPRSRPPPTRRATSTTSTTSASPKSLAHFFTASESDFLRKVCEYGYACD